MTVMGELSQSSSYVPVSVLVSINIFVKKFNGVVSEYVYVLSISERHARNYRSNSLCACFDTNFLNIKRYLVIELSASVRSKASWRRAEFDYSPIDMFLSFYFYQI